MAPLRTIAKDELEKHVTKEDLWVVLHGKVYDLTAFLPDHPGGASIILKYAGKDGTKAFDPIHPRDIMEKLLPPEALVGLADPALAGGAGGEEALDEHEVARREAEKNKPALGEMLNLLDFEAVAKRVMTREAWAYYSSGADDEITLRENHSSFHRIFFRPRILVNVREVDFSTKILGYPSSVPFYITATALGKLGHPDGEIVLTRAAHAQGVIQMVPTLASYSLDEITAAAAPGQTQFFQLYVNKDRDITRRLVEQAGRRGCKAIFITVDAPQLGRREKDMRMKFKDDADVQKGDAGVDRSQGAARAISSFIDPGLCWDDIAWFRSITNLPLILKGVQCGEDTVQAAEYGLDGVVLSNHGGRQLDFARSGIEVLPEAVRDLRAAGFAGPAGGPKFVNSARKPFELFVDGGVRRGTDILKAVCLGATAVGIGRPFLYAMSSYGDDGVIRAIQLLKDEMEMAMRLLGATKLSQLNERMVITKSLETHVGPIPEDWMSASVYDRLGPAKSRDAKL
ncbi:cytochrome b2 [Hyaloraphidium curvatum]|nr:cytochrome b2 [Hyaloraphidium curvatum]